MINGEYLARRIERQFLEQILLFQKTIHDRILPSFETVNQEAEKIKDGMWEKFQITYDPEIDQDPMTAAEDAEMAGIDHYIAVRNVRQAIINAFLVTSHHLLEQQMLILMRFEIWPPQQEQAPPPKEIDKSFKEALLTKGIDVTQFNEWTKLSELRLIANTIKHADGSSADKLRQLRPDLFSSSKCFSDETQKPSPIFRGMPAFGDEIEIDPKELDKNLQNIISFWNTLAHRFRFRDNVESASLF